MPPFGLFFKVDLDKNSKNNQKFLVQYAALVKVVFVNFVRKQSAFA